MRWSALAFVVSIHAVTPAFAAPPTADQIMQAVEDKPYGKDASAHHRIQIIPKGGQPRFREYTILRKEYPDVIKLVTFLSAPTSVLGAAFMVWDYKLKPDLRWIYLPAIGQVRQLVVADSRSSFFGSDFVYEDFTNRDPDLDTHKLKGSQPVDGRDCWLIESTPKNPSGLNFVKRDVWIWKDDPIELREELLDAQGKVIRRIQVKKLAKIDGVWTNLQVIADDLQTGSESRIEATNVQYNTGLSDAVFTSTQLPRGAPNPSAAPPPPPPPPPAAKQPPAAHP